MTRRRNVLSPLDSAVFLEDHGQNVQPRSGLITFWAIVSLPIFLCMLCVVLEVGNLWLARIQLKNALEAGALAAVKNWGDAGGGDTNISRQVGNQFASVSLINGAVVDLSTIDATLNYNAMNGTNQNGNCTGVFVFGAITDDSPEYVFDSCSAAGCGPPFTVAMDATSQGNMGGSGGNNNEWGISIQPTQQLTNLSITRVTYRLPATYVTGSGTFNPNFDFTNFAPNASANTLDTDVNNKLVCSPGSINCTATDGVAGPGGNSQADVFGVDPSQVQFLIDVPYGPDGTGRLECTGAGTVVTGITDPTFVTKTLTVEFCDAGIPGCDPFIPGDRMRFGAFVRDFAGTGQLDADDIGAMGVEVTICFSDGSFLQGVFGDNTEVNLGPDCRCNNATFPSWGSCLSPRQGTTIHPAGLPDVPCPSGSASNNNGQALVMINNPGGSGFGFAVRAQTSYDVPSICKNVFGLPIGPFCVTATVDAFYDCTSRRPRIYHLDSGNLTCVAPCPP